MDGAEFIAESNPVIWLLQITSSVPPNVGGELTERVNPAVGSLLPAFAYGLFSSSMYGAQLCQLNERHHRHEHQVFG
jgi:hypothetical protein